MPTYIDRYNVSWPSPSERPADAMPVGNGDLAANVQTDTNGDILLTLAKGDAWDESATLLKLGRLRIRLSPRLRRDREPFVQTLHVDQAMVEVVAGAGGSERRVRVWVDAHEPLLVVEVDSPAPVHVLTELLHWRTAERDLAPHELSGVHGWVQAPRRQVRTADTTVADRNDHLVWYHHNQTSCWPESMALQDLDEIWGGDKDPLLHRTFGCLVRATGHKRLSETELRTELTTKRTRILVCAHCCQASSPAKWLRDVVQRSAGYQDRDWAAAYAAHCAWWEAFWERSYIHLGPLTSRDEQSAAFRISRGYQLQRYLNACAGRSAYPIHTNGSLFTFETNVRGEAVDADFRRWGGLYAMQATRLVYWPMLAAGDGDLMRPLFRMYRDALPLARRRCLHYFGHAGAHFPEQMTFWGTLPNDAYGWSREGRQPREIQSDLLRHHYTGMLELTALMAQYVSYTADADFARDYLLPMAREVLLFFDEHFPRDDSGHLDMSPSQALETYTRQVRNPMPDVAGLHWLLDRLLGPLACYATPQDLMAWTDLYPELPPLPVSAPTDTPRLLPAEDYEPQTIDTEAPELYAVFPFRLFGLDRETLAAPLNSFRQRHFRHSGGRQTTGVVAARLGELEPAWQSVMEHLASRPTESRFPVYWGPHFNWIPDQDQGNVGMLVLQQMLLQETQGQLHALPCWPDDCDVHCRLQAPGQVSVELTVVAGRIVRARATDADGNPVDLQTHPLRHRHPQTPR